MSQPGIDQSYAEFRAERASSLANTDHTHTGPMMGRMVTGEAVRVLKNNFRFTQYTPLQTVPLSRVTPARHPGRYTIQLASGEEWYDIDNAETRAEAEHEITRRKAVQGQLKFRIVEPTV